MKRLYRLLELYRRPFFQKAAFVNFESRANAEEMADFQEYKKITGDLTDEARDLPMGTKVAFIRRASEIHYGVLYEPALPQGYSAKVVNTKTELVETVLIQTMEKTND